MRLPWQNSVPFEHVVAKIEYYAQLAAEQAAATAAAVFHLRPHVLHLLLPVSPSSFPTFPRAQR
jgi:hypothetical protein